MATQTTNKSQTNKSNGATAPGHPLTDSMQASLHASVDKLADSAGIAEENLRKTATSSAENMSARKRLAEKKWHASKVRAYAVENPVATAGIAFAVGMLATALFRKK